MLSLYSFAVVIIILHCIQQRIPAFCYSYFMSLSECGTSATEWLHHPCPTETVAGALATDIEHFQLPYRTSDLSVCTGTSTCTTKSFS